MTDKKRVLLVEDDEMMLRATRRHLQTIGCDVVTAINYLDGRARLDDGRYALIISDNKMPIGMEIQTHKTAGIELLAYAAHDARHSGTPLVLYTGDDSDQTMDALKHIGAHYLYKPSPNFAEEIGKFLEPKA